MARGLAALRDAGVGAVIAVLLAALVVLVAMWLGQQLAEHSPYPEDGDAVE